MYYSHENVTVRYLSSPTSLCLKCQRIKCCIREDKARFQCESTNAYGAN